MIQRCNSSADFPSRLARIRTCRAAYLGVSPGSTKTRPRTPSRSHVVAFWRVFDPRGIESGSLGPQPTAKAAATANVRAVERRRTVRDFTQPLERAEGSAGEDAFEELEGAGILRLSEPEHRLLADLGVAVFLRDANQIGDALAV